MKRKARGSEPTGEVAASPNLTVTHTVDLGPADWMRATWRPRTPLPRPPVETVPFNLDASLEQLSQAMGDRTHRILWNLGEPPTWSREEAHFWLVALTEPFDERKAPELVERLSRLTFTGQPSLNQVVQRFKAWESQPAVFKPVLRALVALLSPAQLLQLVCRAPGWPDFKRHCASPYDWWPTEVLEWFARDVFPYLTNEDLEAARPALREQMQDHPWPTKGAVFPDPAYYLAALAGLHDELLEVVRAWPDDAYTSQR
jgi:hypothetical protein